MNTIALQATVSAEPELHQQQTGQSRTSLMLQFPAHQSGEDDFTIRLVAFGGLADEIAESLHIGTAVIIEGRMQTDIRTNPDGSKEKTTEIIARRVIPLIAPAPVAVEPPAPPKTVAAALKSVAPTGRSASRQVRPAGQRPQTKVYGGEDIEF
jgi:single-strand DNA-binding protein